MFRSTFSTTTMASSTTMPMAKTRPNNDSALIENPIGNMTAKVPIRETGTAQLVRLPEWKVGEQRQLIMHYGLKVLGRYKGRLDAQWMLPTSGSQIGDTWAVGA